ncbi:Tousled-like kinase [Cyanidiococcus yangmingshanensis]|uniref:Tousled-like kinase n=1 Tax=Cyanidiococcus yangmingshanensis TaxID=2690220 RepID=A0A7J7INV7_9RHOD|nr:Tousled-like kinase [Cyanidiococcus yangmingshanensis]
MNSVFDCDPRCCAQSAGSVSVDSVNETLVLGSQRAPVRTLREKLALLERRLNPRPWDSGVGSGEALASPAESRPYRMISGRTRIAAPIAPCTNVEAANNSGATLQVLSEMKSSKECGTENSDGCDPLTDIADEAIKLEERVCQQEPFSRCAVFQSASAPSDEQEAAAASNPALYRSGDASIERVPQGLEIRQAGSNESLASSRTQMPQSGVSETRVRDSGNKAELVEEISMKPRRVSVDSDWALGSGPQPANSGSTCSVAETVLPRGGCVDRCACPTELSTRTPPRTPASRGNSSTSPISSGTGERTCRSEPLRQVREWPTPGMMEERNTFTRPRKRRARVPPVDQNNGITLDQFFSRTERARPDSSVLVREFEMDSLADEESYDSRLPGSQSSQGRSRTDHVTTKESVADIRRQYQDQIKGLSAQLDELRSVALELESTQERLSTMERSADALRHALVDTLRDHGKLERVWSARKTAEKCEKLGQPVVARTGTALQEVWEDGVEFIRLNERQNAVAAERESIEKSRKELSKLRRPSASNADSISDAPQWLTTHIAEQEEIFRLRMQSLKRDEAALAEERTKLECERAVLLRELKRARDESGSRFRDFPLLANRYLLLRMLGRGGFSEVWKAFDLTQVRHVACKIHQLHSYWSEARKSNYIRHATREYRIHAALKHPRIVSLFDVFEIDDHTFCTVLEYCGEACDLDTYLKMNRYVSEREAKSIIAQVLSALLYLNSQPKRIIHYDLKPGNILYTNGEVRITDFGLSKIMDEHLNTMDGMELTSQGAGTYWYLPPECFEPMRREEGPLGPRISSKVDVWSCGVIMFQLLYGMKPFGNDLTQERILRDQTILKASEQDLCFPSKPIVSAEAKDFIRLCLTRNQADRPDIRSIALHPFLRGTHSQS